MLNRVVILSTVIGVAILGVPSAKADLIFTGSDITVLLQSVSSTDVRVTVTLNGGAAAFVNTGNGSNHPGFAFNLAGPSITVANIVNTLNLGSFHVGPVVTNGSALGTFGYFFDNLGNGASAHNTGSIAFDIVRPSGIAVSDFLPNGSRNYFAADTNGGEGEVGINARPTTVGADDAEGASGVAVPGLPGDVSSNTFDASTLNSNTADITVSPTAVIAADVPEPATVLLFGTVFIGFMASRRRLSRQL